MRKISLLAAAILFSVSALFAQEPAPATPDMQAEPAAEPPAFEATPAQSPAEEVPPPPAVVPGETAPPAPAMPEPPPATGTPAPAPSAKIVVFLPERIENAWFWFYYTEEIQHIVQTAVERALINAGLEVIDVATATFESTGNLDQVTSKEHAVGKAKEMGAQFVIMGTATADPAGSSMAYGLNVVRVSADITARLVRVSDGKILAVEQASATAGGQALRGAGKDALKDAGTAIARKLALAAKAAAAAPQAP